MIYGSLVKINPIDSDIKLWEQKDPLNNKSVDLELEFIVLKELQYMTLPSAMKSFNAFISLIRLESEKDKYALALRSKREIRLTREVTLVRHKEGSVTAQFVVNPLWTGHKPTKRNTATHGIHFPITPALQSQMFAMLESSTSDSKWMQQFKLKDNQQDEMYKWQQEYFPPKNVMNTFDMQNMMKNVLNVARLPWIKLDFVENSKVCSFSISGEGGKVIVTGDGNEDSNGGWDWLKKTSEDNFEIVGELNTNSRIKISSMKLTMAIEWAMCPQFLLHELAHYIAFCIPTSYRLNQGDETMSFLEYEDVFAGHGSLYMAIFSRLLIDFMYIKPDALYRSIESSGLAYFRIESLRTDSVNNGITDYLSHKSLT